MASIPAPAGGGPVPPAPTVKVWTENPLTGDFNPGTVSGQKIFLEKTKGLDTDKRLALTNSNAQKIMEILKVKEQVMGSVVTFIPTTYNGGTGTDHKNLIHQSPSISLESCQRAAFARFGTSLVGDNAPIPDQPWLTVDLDPAVNAGDKAKFYDRVNGNVVVELLKNILTPNGFEDLMLQQEKFTFASTTGVKRYDGPTMLKVALEEINPTSAVNIEMHRQAIEGAKLHDFKNNVVEMLKAIEKHHQAIVSNNHKYDGDTYRRHLLSALLTGANATFNTKIDQIKSDVDACYGYHSDITPSALITLAKQLYTNIDCRREWSKVDPKDAQIMALTTKLNEKVSAKAPVTADKNNAKMSDEEFFIWRKTHQGPSVVRMGKTWNWCPHHKKEGHYDGLYYANHTAETHDAWKARGKQGGAKTTEVPDAKTTSANATSLKISETLKQALCTNLCVSEEDLAKIIDSVESLN